MTIYFSSKNIPELAKLSVKERQEAIAKVQQKFTAPEKLILNLLKLIMLVPPFLFLARQEWGLGMIALFGTILIYLLVFTPLILAFSKQKLK